MNTTRCTAERGDVSRLDFTCLRYYKGHGGLGLHSPGFTLTRCALRHAVGYVANQGLRVCSGAWLVCCWETSAGIECRGDVILSLGRKHKLYPSLLSLSSYH